MKLLTANRLSDGLVLWLSHGQWVEDAAKASVLEDDEADMALEAWKARETEVVGAYLIPLEADHPIKREKVRENIRANGPTIGATALDTAKSFKRDPIF